MPRKAKCSTHIWTEEEDAVVREEGDSAKEESDEVRLTTTTPNFGNKTETIKECSEEGGASIPVRADKTRSNADIAAMSATGKESAKRRCTSWPPQVDNSPITPPTPSTTTTVDYS